MNDKTKEIFAAPWTIEEEAPLAWYCVIDSKDSVVANDVRDQKTVNRLARLPELYDTLFEITMERCAKCVASHANRGIQAPLGFDFFTGECPFETDEYFDGDPCVWRQRWKLLGKVRDGQK